ncbi:hypothetical protein BY458DRAFT_274489 [Sporodiniella umbellata]|nr:hypothetical protein BY458DRAFT_274489 [Sporodiniella umbellata]
MSQPEYCLQKNTNSIKSEPTKMSVDSNPTVDVESFTGIRLKRRLVSDAICKRGLQNVRFITLTNIQSHVAQYNTIRIEIKPSPDWATIGVVDKCAHNEDFCVVRITNLKGDYLHVYITDKAYKKFENAIGMGSVLALKRPFVLPSSKFIVA